MTDATTPVKPAKQRKQEQRQHDRQGIGLGRVPCFDNRLIEALIASGQITEAASRIPANITAAKAEIIGDWMKLSAADHEKLKYWSRVTGHRKKRA